MKSYRIPCLLGIALLFLSMAAPAQPAPQGVIVVPPSDQIQVSIQADKATYSIGERVTITYQISVSAYVYAFDIDPTNKVTQIFPNGYSQDNFVSAGVHHLPDSATYSLIITPPSGTEVLYVIASLGPLAFDFGVDGFPQPFPQLGDAQTFQSQTQAAIQGVVPTGNLATAFTTFQISASAPGPTLPDLVIESLRFDPERPAAGQTLTGFFSVRNIGAVSASRFRVTVATGVGQSALDISSLRAGETRNLSFQTLFPGGQLTFTVTADALNQVQETNENNNTMSLNVVERTIGPRAAFSFSPQSPRVGEPVTFDASASSSSGGIIDYRWDFNGDGQIDALGQRVVTQFSAQGSFNVALTVVDVQGLSAFTSQTVFVSAVQQQRAPVASFTFTPTTVLVGGAVLFDASASMDPDGFIAEYRWDFNGDGQLDATGVRVSVRFNNAGSARVTLTVVDNQGLSASTTQTISITQQQLQRPPVASFTFTPTTVLVGQAVLFDASASVDPDGSIAEYRWDFNGDGQLDATGVRVSVRFNNAGSARVTLTVVDNQGLSASTTQTISILQSQAQQPPVARFKVSPALINIGQSVTLDASESFDPDGFIAQYLWDINGDGRADLAGQQVVTQFALPGAAQVTLTVVDNQGLSASTSQTLSIGRQNQAPVARFTLSRTEPVVGEMVNFDASASSDSDGFIVQYLWDFDSNGTTDASGAQAAIRFNSPGVARVTLTVVDNEGLQGTTTQVAQVKLSATSSATGFQVDTPEPNVLRIRIQGSPNWAGQEHLFGLKLETNGQFLSMTRQTEGTAVPVPQGVVPVANPQLLELQSTVRNNAVTYWIRLSSQVTEVKLTLQLDTDGDGNVEQESRLVFVGTALKTPPANPFLIKFMSGRIMIENDTRICRIVESSSATRVTLCWLYSAL